MNTINSEQGILSCFLISPELLKITILKKKHFTIREYSALFEQMLKMLQEWLSIDAISISSYYSWTTTDEMFELSTVAITSRNFETYENLIIQNYNKKMLTDCARRIEAGTDQLDYHDISKMMHESLAWIEQKEIVDTMFPWVYDTMHLYFNSDESPIFITETTGYSQLDFFTWWWRKWWLYVIAARPKVGKSSVMLNFCMVLRKQWINTSIHSFEMTAQEIHERAICLTCDVEARQLHKKLPEVIEKVTNVMWKIVEKSWCYIHTSRMFHDIERNIAHDVANGVKVVFIDYLQLIRIESYRWNKNNMVEDITGTLKILAGKYWIAIVLLSQLSREAAKAPEPELHHLRDSWSIEQDASCVMFLQRDPYSETIDIKIKANRNGECGYMALPYTSKYFKMLNW